MKRYFGSPSSIPPYWYRRENYEFHQNPQYHFVLQANIIEDKVSLPTAENLGKDENVSANVAEFDDQDTAAVFR